MVATLKLSAMGAGLLPDKEQTNYLPLHAIYLFSPLMLSYPFFPSHRHSSPPFSLCFPLEQFPRPCSSVLLSLYFLPSFLTVFLM
jgi:hypothetical protein